MFDRVQARAAALLGRAAQEILHHAGRADTVAGPDAEEIAALLADVHASGADGIARVVAAAIDPHGSTLEALLGSRFS